MSNLSEIIDRLERVGQGEGAHALRHVRDVAEQRQADLVAKDDRIRDYMNICEDLSRKLEEARVRIGELEHELDREKKLHQQANTMRIQQMDRDSARIASLEAALKPFAEIAAAVADMTEGWSNFDFAPVGLQYPAPRLGDLRRARNELEGSQTATEAQIAPEAPGAITEHRD